MKLTLKAIAAHTYEVTSAPPNPHRFDGAVKAADEWAKKHPNPFSHRRRKPYVANSDTASDHR